MSDSTKIEEALAPLKDMLSADGYELEIREQNPEYIVAQIRAGEDACPDCLVPKKMMSNYFVKALRDSLDTEVPEVRLVYPND